MRQLYLTSSSLEPVQFTNAFNVIRPNSRLVTEELWLGQFSLSGEEFRKCLVLFSHCIQLTFHDCVLRNIEKESMEFGEEQKFRTEHISLEGCKDGLTTASVVKLVSAAAGSQLILSLKDINLYDTNIDLQELEQALEGVDHDIQFVNQKISENYVKKSV
eukprot:CAMPEP_0168318362 /NCGR_PEP_ID=MMETSP0213-20121227/433_1 /TAXON_ID=151035 /ORGANISM="Euplotes harpa, Strain FSP1.4" /LENGTH=159 /DNA_ID=CAMNT_0008319413 /DNA_START=338 /DNA_END=814 /DNA_ORIENTATION=+